MPSPFPGMDPYLENPAIWSDFHLTFNGAMRAELNKLLPDRYAARIDRYVWIEDNGLEETKILGRPDVYIADSLPGAGEESEGVITAPATITLPTVERETKSYLKIIDVKTHRVVTVIELLSPANKTPGKDHQAYLAKRNQYLAAGVNLVEIDLLRAGLRPSNEEGAPDSDYYVVVSRACDYPKAGIWRLSVRDSLPPISVPLVPPDAPVTLNLQQCMNRAYDDGRYGREIDYSLPPEPPLRASDSTWMRKLLTE